MRGGSSESGTSSLISSYGVDLALTLAPALFVEGTGIFDTTRLSKEA
jgi:hypothetical protein